MANEDGVKPNNEVDSTYLLVEIKGWVSRALSGNLYTKDENRSLMTLKKALQKLSRSFDPNTLLLAHAVAKRLGWSPDDKVLRKQPEAETGQKDFRRVSYCIKDLFEIQEKTRPILLCDFVDTTTRCDMVGLEIAFRALSDSWQPKWENRTEEKNSQVLLIFLIQALNDLASSVSNKVFKDGKVAKLTIKK